MANKETMEIDPQIVAEFKARKHPLTAKANAIERLVRKHLKPRSNV
jgi:hypothetical protein